jgi:hypothetical protein
VGAVPLALAPLQYGELRSDVLYITAAITQLVLQSAFGLKLSATQLTKYLMLEMEYRRHRAS